MWNKVIWIKIYHGNRNTICTCNVHRIFYLLVTFFINNIWLYRYFGCLLCGTIQYIKRLLHIILYTYCMLFDVYIHLNENKIINCHFFFLKRRHIVHCVTQITLSFVYRKKVIFFPYTYTMLTDAEYARRWFCHPYINTYIHLYICLPL